MKTERSRFPVGTLIIVILHLILCLTEQMYPVEGAVSDPESHPIREIVLLAAFLGTFAVMAWEMRLFTSKTSRIADFALDFLSCLMQMILIGIGEIIAAFLLSSILVRVWSRTEGFIWVIICVAMLILCGIVTFVTGAARTMMYHDEKR